MAKRTADSLGNSLEDLIKNLAKNNFILNKSGNRYILKSYPERDEERSANNFMGGGGLVPGALDKQDSQHIDKLLQGKNHLEVVNPEVRKRINERRK